MLGQDENMDEDLPGAHPQSSSEEESDSDGEVC